MEGKVLKEKIKQSGISYSELSRRLGILPQSLAAIFNTSDVKTGLVEKIAQVIGVHLSYFFDNYDERNSNGEYSSYRGATPESLEEAQKQNVLLRQEIKFLKEKIQQLETLANEKERLIKTYNFFLKENNISSPEETEE